MKEGILYPRVLQTYTYVYISKQIDIQIYTSTKSCYVIRYIYLKERYISLHKDRLGSTNGNKKNNNNKYKSVYTGQWIERDTFN